MNLRNYLLRRPYSVHIVFKIHTRLSLKILTVNPISIIRLMCRRNPCRR